MIPLSPSPALSGIQHDPTLRPGWREKNESFVNSTNNSKANSGVVVDPSDDRLGTLRAPVVNESRFKRFLAS